MSMLTQSSKGQQSKSRSKYGRNRTVPSTKLDYQLAPHIDLMDQVLVRLTTRELLDRGYLGVIFELPVRCGKSELCSHMFPSWYLGTYPDDLVILTSYEAETAAKFGRRTRDTLTEYGPKLFNVNMTKRTQAADKWTLAEHPDGGMMTTGVGGPITGYGAHVLVVDDPIKNHVEAQSQTMRDRNWDWWQSTARTRLEPEGVVIIVMARWHEDDLVGRLKLQMASDPEADQFLVVTLPMMAGENDLLGREIDTPLWPQRFDLNRCRAIRKSVGPYVWSALYQQRPAPKEGGLFDIDDFEVVDRVPRDAVIKKTVRYWDLAATDPKKGADPDYTVGIKMAETASKEYYILDMQRARSSPGKIETLIKATADRDGRNVRIRIEQEPGSAGKFTVNTFVQKLRGFTVRGKRQTGNKMSRADTFAADVERRNVFLVRGPWNQAFLEEHTFFPFGKHDDIVDAASGAFEDLTGRAGRVTSF